MHKITVCAAAHVVELHNIAFPCFRPLPIDDIFRSRSVVRPWAIRNITETLCESNSLLPVQYLRVWLRCPASGTWKLQNGNKRSDCVTTGKICVAATTRSALPDDIRLQHCCLRRHGEGHSTKNHQLWNCPPPRERTGCLQRRSLSAACRPDLLRFRRTPASDSKNSRNGAKINYENWTRFFLILTVGGDGVPHYIGDGEAHGNRLVSDVSYADSIVAASREELDNGNTASATADEKR
jgi:hypothetical protein